MTTRRSFLARSAVGAAAAGMEGLGATAQLSDAVKQLLPPKHPVIVTRETGDETLATAYTMLLDGEDTLTSAQAEGAPPLLGVAAGNDRRMCDHR